MKKHFKWILVLPLLVLAALIIGTLAGGQGEPVRVACALPLKEQVKGADYIIEITITSARQDNERNTCIYDISLQKPLLGNIESFPKKLVVDGSDSKNCKFVLGKHFLFLANVEKYSFFEKKKLHCRAAYIVPIDREQEINKFLEKTR